MNPVTALRTSAAIIVGVFLAGAAKAETVIMSFQNTGFEYPWGDYTQTIHPTYVNLFMPTNNAGGASNLPDLDLSGFAEQPLTLTARLGSQNTASTISIVLRDTDGTEQKWDFAASSFNSETFTTVTATALNNPGGSLNPGSEPGLNLGAINGFQIWGDFNTDFVFDFDIQKFSAGTLVPEPSTASLIIGGTAAGLALLSRRRDQR